MQKRHFRRGLVSLLFTLVAVAALAVPARPNLWKKIMLADGTEVRARLVGDEFGHFWRGEDGKCYLAVDDTDVFQPVDAQALQQRSSLRRQQINARRQQRQVKRQARLQARRAGTDSESLFTGVKKGLIILVNFSNLSFKSANNQAYYKRVANEVNFTDGEFCGSMSDYFKAQSRGQFELDFDVVGPVKVSKTYSYYGKNVNEEDNAAAEMVIEAVNLVKNTVTNWEQYDWDGDGEVDQVYVIYAGKGEADGGASNTIWPHEYTLYEAKYDGDGTGPVTVATGLKVNTYACGPELNGQTGSIAGIGTMCHEFSHCLGYPDFYDTDYSGGQGMGCWDLMDNGSYNGDGYQPAGYTSYERWVAGWMEPIQLESEDVTVTDMKALSEGGESYVIYNKGHRDEYFMLENRQFSGWDASLPGAGLLILHVDYDQKVWLENTPNDTPSRQRMTWMAADNKYEYELYEGTKYYTDEGMAYDTYPSKKTKNNVFNKSSKPAAKFYNKNSDNSYFMDSSVEAITQNADGTVSFRFVAGTGGSVTPVPGPDVEGMLFYESFDECTGTGGNDDSWNGGIANAAFNTDNEGWVAAKAYGADACAKFGTSNVKGSATTPAFTMNGSADLYFKAGAWNAFNDGTVLNLSVSNGTITPSQVTMTKGEFTDFEAKITATGSVQVTFEAQRGRFFLDEVLVKDPSSTKICIPAVAGNAAQQRIYTLDGRYAGSRLEDLRPGLYIVNGKKVLR